ncbi:MAG: DUF5652 family protein [Patescibacteria group bacterium]
MEQLILEKPWLLWVVVIAAIWTIPWKGVALWKSARLHHRWWFIALLLINTLGLLEIYYIFFVAKKSSLSIEERPKTTL